MHRALAITCCCVLAGCASATPAQSTSEASAPHASGSETPHGEDEQRTASLAPPDAPEETPAETVSTEAVSTEAVSTEAVSTETAQPPRAPITITHDPLAAVCPAIRHSVPDGDVIPSFTVPRALRRPMSELLDRLAQSIMGSGEGRCDIVTLAHESLVSLVCWYAGGDGDEPPHMTTERTIELGDEGPREVSLIRQLDSRAHLDALAGDACRGQSSRPADERCEWVGRGDVGRAYALGPRGVLVILDIDADALRPMSGEVFEVPYRALAGHIVPGSALARYLERCPAALEP